MLSLLARATVLPASSAAISGSVPAKPLTAFTTVSAAAYRALEAGGIMPAVYNGANEAAVDMFIKGMIRFTDIADRVERAMDSIANAAVGSFEELLEYDAMARMAAVKG